MKALLILCFLILIMDDANSGTIVIRTSETDDNIYQFFPLQTNFLQFTVKAKHDIHICLTTMPNFNVPQYHIEFGSWQNTKYRLLKDVVQILSYDGATVNPGFFEQYWIRLNHTEGSISAGKGANDRKIFYKDPAYVEMTYFGISTGWGATGDWHFDSRMISCG